ncbi:hypothetical protein RB628_35145 [Streptomyces sp. ADMS]|uniref:hypothetical protein n=1 Tax=Streptomyces sp. ADMS TaxID=3071415 RepID=UPI00296F6AD2|nr:hypothetical protein [Streptomyces sp. ADMS]MDW4910428.1 hypothetical protein [Streptomyces sp. ADMS]
MGTWDEPGAREWRQAVDAADQLRGPKVPVGELPGYLQGCDEVDEVRRLMADPTVPGALTAARAAMRRALRVTPQSCLDQLCYEQRWRGRNRWDGPLQVCDRPTCGRCLLLKAADGDGNAGHSRTA